MWRRVSSFIAGSMKRVCSRSAAASDPSDFGPCWIFRWKQFRRPWACCVKSAIEYARQVAYGPASPTWNWQVERQGDSCKAEEKLMYPWLKKLGIERINSGVFCGEWRGDGPVTEPISPMDGKPIASVRPASSEDYELAVARAQEAFLNWRRTPAPVRAETIRRLGNTLREVKSDLARLVTLEMGKIIAEGEGEVQEMIDICDFAVGLSRQLYGLTIASERPQHRMLEQWHPLGIVGIITAFNFPVAVWSWNSAL